METLILQRTGTLQDYQNYYNSDFVNIDIDCRAELAHNYPEITYFTATGKFNMDDEYQIFEYIFTINYELQ